MNDNITMTAPSLSDFLARIGLPLAARDRIVEIDRILADEIASGDPDADGCAALAFEAADLISYANPPVFDWKGWDDVDCREGSRYGRYGTRSASGHPSGRDRAATAIRHLSAVRSAATRCDLRCRDGEDWWAGAGTRIALDMGVGDGFDRGNRDGGRDNRRDPMTRKRGQSAPLSTF